MVKVMLHSKYDGTGGNIRTRHYREDTKVHAFIEYEKGICYNLDGPNEWAMQEDLDTGVLVVVAEPETKEPEEYFGSESGE